MAAVDGRILFATARASAWLDSYFGRRSERTRLPAPLYQWLVEEESDATAFSSADGENELEAEIIRGDADGTFCLAVTERSACLPACTAGLKRVTRREAAVLNWLERGKSNGDIAALLHIELATVKKHLQNIFIKLGVHSRMAAVSCWRRARQHAFRPRLTDSESAAQLRVMPPVTSTEARAKVRAAS